MPRIIRSSLLALFALGLVAGCAKHPPVPPPPPPPPVQVEPPPPPPPPPAPAPAPEPVRKVDLTDAFFDYDSYALGEDAKAALSGNGRSLVGSPNVTVMIEGHCDERGTVDYNLALGDKRARAARDFLMTYGVAESRINTVTFGKNRPFDMGHDENAWAKNRRAHFVVQ